jgi:hypothetical protein
MSSVLSCQQHRPRPGDFMNSLPKHRLNTLVSKIKVDTADKFLEELLNLDVMDVPALERFIRRFRHLLPAPGPNRAMNPNLETGVLNWQARLRAAWRQPTPLGREVLLLGIIASHLASPEDQAHPDAYAAVLMRALHLVGRMRICKRKDCQTPYYIWSPKRRNYCSDVCAREAQRAFKLNWWRKDGPEWQRKRRAKAKRLKKSQGKRKGGK